MPNRQFGHGYRFGFNGKEKDDAIYGIGDAIDFGSRIYDPRKGIWMSVDPLQKKYPDLSPYVGMGNNPIFLVDRDGREIVVPNVADRAPILEMINSKALGTFAFDDKGKLYLASPNGDASKFSTYYKDRLVAAIKQPETITIKISELVKRQVPTDETGKHQKDAEGDADEAGERDVDEEFGGGVTIKADAPISDALVVISGHKSVGRDESGKPLTNEPADILLHELVGHAIPHIAGSDTGNAVENENKARKEIGPHTPEKPSPQRQANPDDVE